MPKHVASTTLRDPEWTNTRDRAHGLIDEYRLMIFPVVLGSGLRLWPETPDKTVLRLQDVQRFDTRMVVETYAPVAAI